MGGVILEVAYGRCHMVGGIWEVAYGRWHIAVRVNVLDVVV